LHAKAGTTTRAVSAALAYNRCFTTTIAAAILGVHHNTPVEDGAPDAHLHASFG